MPHRLRLLAVLAVALATACQTVPPAPPAPPSSPPTPSPQASAPARAKFTPVAWTELPGWSNDPVAAAWPAFSSDAAPSAQPNRSRLEGAVRRRDARRRRSDAAVRAFFATILAHTGAADGRQRHGTRHRYYEPLLAGSRMPTADYASRLYGPPDDLLIVDLSELYPELKDKRVRGRVEGRKVVPYWTRAEIERNRRPCRQGARVRRRSGRGVLPRDPGLGRIALTDGTVMRLNYADQNGHPYRSVARVLIDRGELTRERASMQAISAWVQAHPRSARAARRESELRVLSRGACRRRGLARGAHRRAAGLARRAAARGAHDRGRRALRSARRPVYLATTEPLSARRCSGSRWRRTRAARSAARARGFLLGFRDAAGREAGRMRQDGGCGLLWPKERAPGLKPYCSGAGRPRTAVGTPPLLSA
jgi:membrane-bound lytic murein transglycosylase A